MRYPENVLREKALAVKAVVFDNDGVLTDNTEIIGHPEGIVLKRRSHYDGQGISFLRAAGIRVAIISGDSGSGVLAIVQLVERWNSLPSVKAGVWKEVALFTNCAGQEKLTAFYGWAKDIGIEPSECAVMGDDFVDWQILQVAGLRAAPCTAVKEIQEAADFISTRPAGYGAARDFADFILDCKGIDRSTLATK